MALQTSSKRIANWQSSSPQESAKLFFNPSSSTSYHWLCKLLQYLVHLSRTLHLSVKSCLLSVLIATLLLMFRLLGMHVLYHRLTEILSTSLQSFVIRCSLASFIFLLIILVSHLYSSADDMSWNHLGFLYLLSLYKSSISSMIQTCSFVFFLPATSNAESQTAPLNVSTNPLIQVLTIESAANLPPIIASKIAKIFGSLSVSVLNTTVMCYLHFTFSSIFVR